MRIVREAARLHEEIVRARSEGQRYFGDGRLYVERYVAPMQRWAGSHGMEFRVQPYGMPIAAAEE